MRNFAILGPGARQEQVGGGRIHTVEMDGVPVRCAIVETAGPRFDRGDPANERKVLIRVKAFSLNYRDKNRIFTMNRHGANMGFYAVGSDFAAEVLEIGPGVTQVAPGDRVVGDAAYPFSGDAAVPPGIPTNHGSKELQIISELKLARIPDEMTYRDASGFTVGAQTTYSMIRRLEIFEGANVLVTAAKSNTSLFAIHALRNRNVNVYVTSGSTSFERDLKQMGVKEIAIIDHSTPLAGHPALAGAMPGGGMHFVIDPFWDLHFSRSLEVMAMSGKYISCGIYDQYLGLIGKPPLPPQHSGREFLLMLMKNLHVLGNCIGLREDLARALSDYQSGKFKVTIDSTYTSGQEGEFLDRTYNARDRFGKVVYQYS
jgi:NADPH:quinone reductase-like Zn-dependent oxidoreductase